MTRQLDIEFPDSPPPMTLAQLAARWGVSQRTVRRWLRPFEAEIGPRRGNIYTPQQVKIILSHLE